MEDEKIKFNKRLIDRIVIVRENNRTWKGKILEVLDRETFRVENQNASDAPNQEVDIYNIERVL